MDLYYKLLKRPVFTMEDAQKYYNNISSARTAVKRLIDRGMVSKIRRNLYTCISGEPGAPVANRLQIASSLTKTSYISHHTAMEFYGITDQVFYEVYVSSETEFKSFLFDGYTYRFIKPKISDGVEEAKFSGGVRVTNKERTILDSIKDMDRISGFEEVISNVGAINRVKEERLIQYLETYDNQFLYQKVGYILFHMKSKLKLSEMFFSLCKEKAGKSSRYLTSDCKTGKFYAEWNLVVPNSLFQTKNGGLIDADV